jgi:hypothetical protein
MRPEHNHNSMPVDIDYIFDGLDQRDPGDDERRAAVREAAKRLLRAIAENTGVMGRAEAVQHVREAVFWAEASIALNGSVDEPPGRKKPAPSRADS